MRARCPAVPVSHTRVLADRVDLERAGLVGDAVDVHRAVAALRGDVLVQRVPRDTLHVVVVFGDFVHSLACEVRLVRLRCIFGTD